MDTVKKVLSGIGKVLKKIKVPLILLIIGFVGFCIYRYISYSKELVQEMLSNSSVETAAVETRNLMQTITATGKIESAKTRTLSSTIVKDTKITSVNCEVGDYVNEGDILVTFSDEEISKSISQIQEDIVESQATQDINNSSNARQYMYSYGTEYMTIRDMQTAIDDKLKALNEACDAYGKAKEARDAIKAQYEAEPDYVMSTSETNGVDVELADPNVDVSYWETNVAPVQVPNSNKTALYQSLQSAENAVNQAYQNQENAQKAYDNAKLSLTDEVYKGSNNLAGATENYQKQTVTANDSTKELKRKLETYKDSLDDYVILAPISGIVTSVKVEENNSFAGGDLVTIQDCDTMYVSTEIDEYDIPDIKVGQKVVIKTDATRDDELEGVVTELAVAATATASASSNPTYSVKIQVLTKDDRLKLGMTAKLSIILDEVDNVLTVPFNAVVEKEDGQSVVYVLNEKPAPAAEPSKETQADTKTGNKIGKLTKNDNAGNAAVSDQSGTEGTTNMPQFEKKGFFEIVFGKRNKNADEADPSNNQKEVPVTIGMEGDYYTQISGNEIKEGTTVVIPVDDSSRNVLDDMNMMMGGGPGGEPM